MIFTDYRLGDTTALKIEFDLIWHPSHATVHTRDTTVDVMVGAVIVDLIDHYGIEDGQEGHF